MGTSPTGFRSNKRKKCSLVHQNSVEKIKQPQGIFFNHLICSNRMSESDPLLRSPRSFNGTLWTVFSFTEPNSIDFIYSNDQNRFFSSRIQLFIFGVLTDLHIDFCFSHFSFADKCMKLLLLLTDVCVFRHFNCSGVREKKRVNKRLEWSKTI